MSARPQRRSPGALVPLLLAVAVIASAVAVVALKQHSRDLTSRLERLHAEHRRLALEQAQLRLEQATLAGHSRVDTIARKQLGMVEPKDYVIVEAKP